VPFGAASRPIDRPAGQNNLYFATGSATEPRYLAAPGPLNFEAGKVYTYILTIDTEGAPLLLSVTIGVDQTVVLESPGDPEGRPVAQARLRVVNALDVDRPVTVTFAGEPLVEGLVRGETSQELDLESRVYFVNVTDTDGGIFYQGEVVVDGQATPRLTLFVLGDLANVTLVPVPDPTGTVNLTTAQVRFTNANSVAPPLMVFTLNDEETSPDTTLLTPTPDESVSRRTIVIDNLPPLQVSSIGELSAGSVEFQLMARETGEILFVMPPVVLQGGRFYDILLLPGPENGWQTALIPR
jgi:hypothetical protein